MKTFTIIAGIFFGLTGVMVFGYNSFGLSISMIGLWSIPVVLLSQPTYRDVLVRDRKAELTKVALETDDEEPIVSEIRRLKRM
jgi:hypothetical protein